MKNNSQILFSSLFWKVVIFFFVLDLGSKAFMHKFFKYIVCYEGEYCNLKSVFITSIIDGQLYFSHVKHAYYSFSDRVAEKGGFFSLILKGTEFVLNKINFNYDQGLISLLFPILLFVILALLISINRHKPSMNVFYIGSGMILGGGLGNTIELYFFGWATDFIGITKNSFIYKLPLIGGRNGIANIADFSIWIGQIFYLLGLLLARDNKSN